MDTIRVRMTFGEHEFDAEGSDEAVSAHFVKWKALVAPHSAADVATDSDEDPRQSQSVLSTRSDSLEIGRIVKLYGRFVSLESRLRSIDDEIMLALLGQRLLRRNDAVSGNEITGGLRQTGKFDGRVDYRLNKMVDAGDVVVTGARRARRYRLSNQGIKKAQEIARTALAACAQPAAVEPPGK